MRKAALLLLLVAADRAHATDEPLDRLRAREETLAHQAAAATALARQQTWTAYRLARKTSLRFLGAPGTRAEDLQARDTALWAMSRSVAEARALEAERARLHEDREGLARRPRDASPARPLPLVAPVRGPIVVEPGLHEDAVNRVQLREVGLKFLGRMDQEVVAVAAGRVQRIVGLPQGGVAIVTEHDGGYVSVLSGMRDLDVSDGDEVKAGQRVGYVGRTLDGAPVLTLELYHGRKPVDPRPLLRPTTAPRSAAR